MSTAAFSRPDVTAQLARGVTKLLLDHDVAPVAEMPLANGRRADVCGLTARGEVWIVEIKSCLADYACDAKWPDYLDYCDLFFFAVSADFPKDLIPERAGLIVADGFGGAVLRRPEPSALAPARRRMMILAFARLAAARLSQSSL